MKIQVHSSHTNLESVSLKGLTISLLSSGDGTEIIHHKLEQGGRWALAPEEGWLALEYVYIISGELIWKTEEGDTSIKAGDSISAYMITELALFVAATDTEFLYVVSRPYFHNYSNWTQELMDLAVKIEEKDGYTSDHCERIKKLAMMVGEELKLSAYDMFILNQSAFYHDIGKTRVPEEILNKPGKLTQEEYEVMKLHTTHGKELLYERGLPDLRVVGDIVEQHHERYDGKGYPAGRQGNEISILASIIAVVDSFDAMTVDRVYHKGIPVDEALLEIKRNSGTIYHPDIVTAFLNIADQLT
ncbi:HD-GYP domain-containing protein [Cohnella endophytica]|uniref:HD-GYP domain-containing protein n=1 Tax=Cohnella endophytica TaxID=2419778 RepID=A0A494XTQ1_9BACL|nr:HD-GYP domain-containing protein [Cohnella endophytica]RKP51504.1 HD-GYP domain-containing protein [Cohnella endophytica]